MGGLTQVHFKIISIVEFVISAGLLIGLIVVGINKDDGADIASSLNSKTMDVDVFKNLLEGKEGTTGENICEGKKKLLDLANSDCIVNGTVDALEQAGANVTVGYVGELNATGHEPIDYPYWKDDLCPVNIHWHIGAEHLSVGEYDENGKGPEDPYEDEERLGFQCHHYDETDPKFTTPYDWKFCKDMVVGQTYEIHWPHSTAGACGTPNQYQYPFYDGVLCNFDSPDNDITFDNLWRKVAVQGQVFTVVNDESYYYPHLISGMITDGDAGTEVTKYTGSTTGSDRDNEMCSQYTPITWQVDRKCHLISASSFDKVCADMLSMRDDMSPDTHPHGARTLVADELSANNHLNMRY